MAAKPIAPFRPDEAFGLALMIYGLFLLPMGLLAFAMPAFMTSSLIPSPDRRHARLLFGAGYRRFRNLARRLIAGGDAGALSPPP